MALLPHKKQAFGISWHANSKELTLYYKDPFERNQKYLSILVEKKQFSSKACACLKEEKKMKAT